MIWPGKGTAAKPPGPNGLISRSCFFWASFRALSSFGLDSFWKSSICLLWSGVQVELVADEKWEEIRYRRDDRRDAPARRARLDSP